MWLSYGYSFVGHKRFVLRDAKKRYACPTKAEAKESFLLRRRRQVKILKAKLKEAEAQLVAGEKVQY